MSITNEGKQSKWEEWEVDKNPYPYENTSERVIAIEILKELRSIRKALQAKGFSDPTGGP